MKRLTLLSLILLSMMAKADKDRFIQQLTLPDGQTVMIDEGDREPRSTGSYSIRLYSGIEPKFPTDDFLYGEIRRRDGSIKSVELDATESKSNPAIVIIIESAGSGDYLSVDKFKLSNNKQQLQLMGNSGEN
ncbi:hypothetical protein ACH42_00685 [Endozoicomonas sp. (ex Bugula neritina AB1)]|nr:hypothetical protein ACH42_00685 [Endozoicomonas sp. (ex Bugula neritina AB1)]